MTAPVSEVADRLLLPVPVGMRPDGPVVLARAQWPVGEEDVLTPVAGFVLSRFSPLVAEVAERCLRARYGAPPARPAHAGSTALVLASTAGDVTTAEAAASTAGAGRRVAPLLFFQSNPNAVLGHVAARWGLDGPVLSTAPIGDPLADGLAVAELLIADGEAAEVLVIAAELGTPEGESDRAEALLVGRPTGRSVLLPADEPEPAAGPVLVPAELPLTAVPADPAELVLAAPAPAAEPAGLVLPHRTETHRTETHRTETHRTETHRTETHRTEAHRTEARPTEGPR